MSRERHAHGFKRSTRVLKTIFTWWNGATVGLRFTVAKRGKFVGEDEFGNRYYEAKDNKDSYDDRKRRWVIYKGYAEASKISPNSSRPARPGAPSGLRSKVWRDVTSVASGSSLTSSSTVGVRKAGGW